MPVSERLKEFLTWAATVASILGIGYGVGASATSGKKEILEERIRKLEAEVQQGQKTQEGTIAALAKCQTERRSVDKPLNEDAGGPKIAVANGDSGEIKDHLTISVVGITTSRDPFSYLVSANFGAPGKETLSAPRLQVGDRVSYNGYEIRLLAADLTTATFGIREIGATRT